jgi:hypothetical protein
MLLLERRSLAGGGTRVVKDVLVRDRDGSERRWREDVRMYAPGELHGLLRRTGLASVRTEGDFDGREWSADAPRQIAWIRRES